MREQITKGNFKDLFGSSTKAQAEIGTNLPDEAFEGIIERDSDLSKKVRFRRPMLIGTDARDGTRDTRSLS